MGRGMCSVAARVLLLSSIPWVDGYSAAGPLLVRRDVVSAALAILNAVPGPGCDVAVIGASGQGRSAFATAWLQVVVSGLCHARAHFLQFRRHL
jgi:hypothetical protein